MSSQVIQGIGYASIEAVTITIPGTYQTGDVMIIFAYSNAIGAPTLPAGWTSISTASGNSAAWKVGYKIAASNAETSGTWTKASGLICHVYRNLTTIKTFFQVNSSGNAAGGTNMPFASLTNLQCPASSWLVAFGGCSSNLATLGAATSMTQQTIDPAPTAINMIGCDTNGIYGSGTYTGNTVPMGVSTQSRTVTLELMAEPLGPINNFQFVSVGDGMSVSEKIR